MKQHPDRNPDDKAAEEQVQGGQGGLRSPLGCAEARGLRPVSVTRASMPRARRQGGHGLRSAATPSATSSATCSATSSAADARRPLAGVPRRGPALRTRARPRAGRVRRHRQDRLRHARRMRRLQGLGRGQGREARRPARPATAPGQVRMQQGFFTLQQTCPRCRGRGQIMSDPCDNCLGQGRVRKQKTLRSRFRPASTPATASGWPAKARPAATAVRPATCTSKCACREHEIFERDGEHLSCEVPISFMTAALGGSIDVPTLDGQVTIKIPAETQSGRVFRLREKGMKPVRGGTTRRPVLPRRRRDAREPHARTEGPAAEIRRVAARRTASTIIRARNPGSTA